MPKIQISESLLQTLTNHSININQLEELLETAKAELDEPTDENGYLKIELNDTNRPDLWSTAGLARHLNAYLENTSPSELEKKYSFLSEKANPNKKIIVDSALQDIRPYVCGFVVQGKAIDEIMLEELIQTQEKLCHNFGQKRLAVAMGIYREDMIEWPVHYKAANPDTDAFVPLDFTEKMSLRKILQEHPKGKEYGHLISKFDKFPLLIDSQENVLSMPPVINSAHVGAVQEGDSKLFIECTGMNLEQLLLVVNILACDYKDMGFEIVRIPTEYQYDIDRQYFLDFISKDSTTELEKEDSTTEEKKDSTTNPFLKILGLDEEDSTTELEKEDSTTTTVVSPVVFQKNAIVKKSSISQILGREFSNDEIHKALNKMNIVVQNSNEEQFEVCTPYYRNDFLHEVDIVEDILIGYGLSNIEAEYPRSFTIGRISPIEQKSRRAINTMVGLGFQEMLFPYLGSRVDFIEKMYAQEEWDAIEQSFIQLENPLSENYEFVRASILPNLLEVEQVSANSAYPHKICEIGKVVIKDDSNNYGSRTNTTLGFLISDSAIGYTDINSIVAAFCFYNKFDWQAIAFEDSRFIGGRAARILKVEKDTTIEIGYFGEIHPRVLEAWNITMPCVAGEITLDLI